MAFDDAVGRHGGKRDGAGRPAQPNAFPFHRRRMDFSGSHPCHATLEVLPEIPSLRGRAIAREVEAALRRAAAHEGFRLVAYGLEEDRAHLIVEATDAAALGRGMKRLAGLFAFAVNRGLERGRTGKVLADRYRHVVLASPREQRTALAFVRSLSSIVTPP